MAERLDRRRFITVAGAAGGGLALPAVSLAQRRGGAPKQQEPEDVGPPEDLMREHGVLNRILLIYDEAIRRIDARQDVSPDAIKSSADIIRTFIEEYHEKLEEDYLFPRFEKANTLTDLTRVLRSQHEAGRRVTQRINQLATVQTLERPASAASLKDALHQFTRMYRPHEAREDTVLFPALRQIVSKHEFDALGEEFEKKEHALFGDEGFEKVVDRVAGIERTLGIYDLARFTPR
jgi:hemerythrin-like domain-containing protein